MANLGTDAISVPGLEHKHSWNGGQLVLGDNQGALPRFKVTNIKGIHALPDVVTGSSPKIVGGGEYARPGRILGRTVVYSGVLQARTLGELRYQAGLFRGAALPDLTMTEKVMQMVPVAAGLATWRYTARCVQAEMDDEQELGLGAMPTPYQRTFVIAFRLHNPRLLLEPALVVTSAAGTGANNPSAVAANPGTADAIPVIRVTGPVVNPIVSIPGGSQIRINGTLTAGQWIDIDFAAKTILRDNGADWGNLRDVALSTWWDTGRAGIPGGAPGPTNTTVTLTTAAGNPGIGATVRVTFYPAMW